MKAVAEISRLQDNKDDPEDRLGILNLLEETGGFKSTLPVDKIYAVLALIRHNDQKPDHERLLRAWRQVINLLDHYRLVNCSTRYHRQTNSRPFLIALVVDVEGISVVLVRFSVRTVIIDREPCHDLERQSYQVNSVASLRRPGIRGAIQ